MTEEELTEERIRELQRQRHEGMDRCIRLKYPSPFHDCTQDVFADRYTYEAYCDEVLARVLRDYTPDGMQENAIAYWRGQFPSA